MQNSLYLETWGIHSGLEVRSTALTLIELFQLCIWIVQSQLPTIWLHLPILPSQLT